MNENIKTVLLSKLKPDPSNDDERKISAEAMAGLKNTIKRFGLVQPIVVNRRTGFIIGGHQRKRALEELGETHAQVLVVDLDEYEAAALRVGLNNPKTQGEFNVPVNETLDQIERESAELYDALLLDGARKKEPKKAKVEAVDFTDVQDEFIITATGPLPSQPDVLDELRKAIDSIGDVTVDIIVQKVDA